MKILKVSVLTFISIITFTGCSSGDFINDNFVNDNSNDNSNNSSIKKNREKDIIDMSLVSTKIDTNDYSEEIFFQFKDNKFYDIVLIGENYQYPEAEFVSKDTQTNDFKISGKLDTNKEGVYKITYETNNQINGYYYKITRTIFVVKNTAPKLTLKGDSKITLRLNGSYRDPGVTVQDREEKELNKIISTSNLDTSKEGIYTITYTVTDRGGLTDTKTRTVHVKKENDLQFTILENSDKETVDLSKYLISKNQTKSVQEFENDQLEKEKIRQIEEGVVKFFYTKKQISYDVTDSSIVVTEGNETTSLNKIVSLDETLSTETSCKLEGIYNSISLNNKVYSDVIEIKCGVETGYYQNSNGLIARNIEKNIENVPTYKTVEINPEIKKISINKSETPQLETKGMESLILLNAKVLQDTYNLTGKNIKIGIVDSGNINVDNKEFSKDKVDLLFPDYDYSSHSQFVAGVIASQGYNFYSRGFAPNSELSILSYYEESYSSSFLYLKENDVYISNHSYIPSYNYFGEYKTLSQNSDAVIYQNPYIIPVLGAGNDREEYTDYNGYYSIKDFSNAKNVITVGAVDKNKELTYFSSCGPATPKGRIKPDIVAFGKNVYSTSEEDYRTGQGTSFSAPAITGLIALLQEEYTKLYQNNMRNDYIKALLIQSSTDLGRKGPDYQYGYGLPNGEKAIEIMKNEKLIKMDTISKDFQQEFTFEVKDFQQEFKSTLVWIDPTADVSWWGTELFTEDLNTDLDIWVEDENGKIIAYPYTLDPKNIEMEAQTDKLNHIDNVVQIQTTLTQGKYKFVIKASKMELSENQDYTLITNIDTLEKTEDYSLNTVKLNEFESNFFELQ